MKRFWSWLLPVLALLVGLVTGFTLAWLLYLRVLAILIVGI